MSTQRFIPGYDENYWVDDDGHVWTRRRRGSRGGQLVAHVGSHGYLVVALCTPGSSTVTTRTVHSLVMECFCGPLPDGWEVRHLNGIPIDNRLANLAYGTKSENAQDTLRHGTNVNVNKTHCPQGHPYDDANTYRNTFGRRVCRACDRARTLARHYRRMAER